MTQSTSKRAAFLRGNPAEVLAAAARRLGRTVDAAQLAARFEAHPSPTSLRALVEIAPEFGVTARAFRVERGGYADVALPAVAHVEVDGEAAFALVLERRGAAWVLEGPAGMGSAELDDDAFASVARGVFVTLAGDGDVRASPAARPTSTADAPGGALGLRARAVALVLAACVAGWAALDAPALAALAVLSGVGAAIGATLVLASRRSTVPVGTPALAARVCGRSSAFDCAGVLGSRWARVGGVELSVVGLAWFTAAGVLALVAAFAAPDAQAARVVLAALWLAAVPGALWLVGVQVLALKRVCPLCMAVHALVVVNAAIALSAALGGGAPPAIDVAAWALAFALALAAALGIAPSWLELSLESRVLRTRLGWTAATPWGALAEAAGRPAAYAEAPYATFRVGSASAPLKLVALVHPMCSACPPVIEELERLVARQPRLSVAFLLPPRDRASAADRALCTAVAAIGLAAGGEQTLHVLRAIEQQPWGYLALARDGGEAAVAAKFLPDGFDLAPFLAGARRAVDEAARLADALERGTPTVLVAGRPWDAPLDGLEALLAQHPGVLAVALGLPEGALDEREARA